MSETPTGWLTPTRAVWGVVAAHACIPATVELTAGDVDPFLYNALAKAAQLPVVVVVLAATAGACCAGGGFAPRAVLGSLSTYMLRWGNGTAPLWRAVWRMPLVWLSVCFFDYALFAWSADLVDTAVSTALMQTWPAVFMVLLVKVQPVETRRTIGLSGWAAAAAGTVGVMMVLAAQGGGWDQLLTGPQWRSHAAGAALALAAGTLSGAAPWTTIVFGELLWERHRPHLAGGAAPAQRLWFTLVGFAAGLAVSVVLNLAAAAWRSFDGLVLTPTAVVGASALGGVLLAPAAVLIRKANLDTVNAAANVALFASPALALALLALMGIQVGSLGLFAAGAAMILAANIAARVRFRSTTTGPHTVV